MLLAIIIRRGRAASERVTRTRGRAVASAASLRYKPGGDGAACRTLRARCRACSPRAAMTTRLLGAHARTRVVMAQRHGVVDCPWPRPAAVPTCCRRRSSSLLHRRSCQRAQLPWHVRVQVRPRFLRDSRGPPGGDAAQLEGVRAAEPRGRAGQAHRQRRT